MKLKTVIVTGGAGFIGSALVKRLIRSGEYHVVNVDKLTYAGNVRNIEDVMEHPQHTFVQADIADRTRMDELFQTWEPCGVLHLAAESHVERSIANPSDFVQTNIIGTYQLLEAARHYWKRLAKQDARSFIFQHISTDEVFGSCEGKEPFTEESPYSPTSPYAATKAAADHLVRAWGKTYGLPFIVTHATNTYGPQQYPEKLIPLTIYSLLNQRPIELFGDGGYVRDWLYIDDHITALMWAFECGQVGQSYNASSETRLTNGEVVRAVQELLTQEFEFKMVDPELIRFTPSKAGHDASYQLNHLKLSAASGWQPVAKWQESLRVTIDWYLRHPHWWSGF